MAECMSKVSIKVLSGHHSDLKFYVNGYRFLCGTNALLDKLHGRRSCPLPLMKALLGNDDEVLRRNLHDRGGEEVPQRKSTLFGCDES